MFHKCILPLFVVIFSCSVYATGIPIGLIPYQCFFKGKVIRVLDGDTIEVLQEDKPVRVRLANIDAPEKKQAYGYWSTKQLKGLVAAQPVTVTYTQTDRYGRIIGRVFTTNGIEANRFMVLSGAAWVYERYNADNALPALQREAQKMKLGLWADSQPVPPWEWRHKQN
ncbi:thermonuclease family protein [Salmonella enterica]|nr:thermonuclease family protein [Salmonella enterica subsp. enterica serovar Minnesota]EHD3612569.1 thermonuclease family protein [Salmonella enterica]EJF6178537.1 thermonuclease family protein [Salmonella enterica]EMC7636587.1 thermonuclease family protein [Salmonella enterica]